MKKVFGLLFVLMLLVGCSAQRVTPIVEGLVESGISSVVDSLYKELLTTDKIPFNEKAMLVELFEERVLASGKVDELVADITGAIVESDAYNESLESLQDARSKYEDANEEILTILKEIDEGPSEGNSAWEWITSFF